VDDYRINERRLLSELNIEPPKGLDGGQRQIFKDFAEWCKTMGVRTSSPCSVAAYLQTLPNNMCLAVVAAVAAAHEDSVLPNPTATHPVRTVLNRRITIRAPASWSRQDQQSFAELPAQIRGVLLKREEERDRALRRKQNDLDKAMKSLAAEPQIKSLNKEQQENGHEIGQELVPAK
jgi:hypothetical protein